LLSYLPKRSTEIYGAQYGNAMLASLGGTPTWRPEINENIWNSLPFFKQLLFSCEILYIQINVPPNAALTVQTAKAHEESPFLHKRKLPDAMLALRRVNSQKFKTLCFQNGRRYRA